MKKPFDSDEPMTPDTIASEFETIVREDGPWSCAAFEVAPGLWTSPRNPWNWLRAKFALENACLMLGKAPKQLRVLDLGCLEGQIAIDMARMGCTAVGLEYRRASVRKAEFAARALNVANVTFVQGDMLQVASLNLGTFDVVLAFGVLYHVDAPDLLPFIKSINQVCTGLAIFDTHVSLETLERYVDPTGLQLTGRSIVEHVAGDDKEAKSWAAAESDFAFWMTERSLSNLLISGGLGPVNRSLAPVPEWKWQDRGYWIAYASSFRTKRVPRTNPHMTRLLADPDPRQAECDLIRTPYQRRVKNPVTKPTQTTAA